MRVLIVDDDIPTTQAIKKSIDWNLMSIYNVDVAHNISRAKSIISENVPDVIICDIEMPKGSGIDLIKWVRENKMECKFVFLTCHDEFIYASEAINYGTEAYITKPFEVEKLQMAIIKAIEKITYNQELKLFSNYGEKWINSSIRREKSFWRELISGMLDEEMKNIGDEIETRGFEIDIVSKYRLILGSVKETHLKEKGWDSTTFRYALANISSEIMMDRTDAVRVVDYYISGRYMVAIIMSGNHEIDEINKKCRKLISMCTKYLQCSITCYTSGKKMIENLSEIRALLEEADALNLIKTNTVIHVDEHRNNKGCAASGYEFDCDKIENLLYNEKSVEAVNMLRAELESIAAKGILNLEIMRSIQHDYMQIIYSILYKNDVQAHELFSDAPSRNLLKLSESSVFEMMKWASYVTSKTFEYIKETREAETIVEKLKRYMADNYSKKLSRNDIASNVFLSPDYVSKIFYKETGVYIKDYLNELRLEKAKQLLHEGNMNISEIAVAVGFENFSYFSTLFKKSTGVSPSEYKKNHIK